MTMMIEHRRVESSRARGRRANHCFAMDARAAHVWLHVRGFSTSESVMDISCWHRGEQGLLPWSNLLHGLCQAEAV